MGQHSRGPGPAGGGCDSRGRSTPERPHSGIRLTRGSGAQAASSHLYFTPAPSPRSRSPQGTAAVPAAGGAPTTRAAPPASVAAAPPPAVPRPAAPPAPRGPSPGPPLTAPCPARAPARALRPEWAGLSPGPAPRRRRIAAAILCGCGRCAGLGASLVRVGHLRSNPFSCTDPSVRARRRPGRPGRFPSPALRACGAAGREAGRACHRAQRAGPGGASRLRPRSAERGRSRLAAARRAQARVSDRPRPLPRPWLPPAGLRSCAGR